MSRKRPKKKRAEEAVPEEILAEGSGPNDAEALAEAATQAFAGDAAGDEVFVPVPDPGEPKHKRGKRREVVVAADAPVEEVIYEAPESADGSGDESAVPEMAADVEPDAAPPRRKRSKQHEVASDDVAVQATVDVDPAMEATVLDTEIGPEVEEAEVAAAQSADADEQALEDTLMRAEAEAELGAPEPEAPAGEEEIELNPSLPTTAATMDDLKLKHLVEALVFAADKPVTLQRLRQLTRISDIKRLETALAELAAEYADRGIALQVVSGGYQFRTNTQFSTWVQQLIAGRPVRLSRAQLETLAIIAYRQPITRPEIDEIRGVDSGATLRLLMDRSLIRILGKKEEVGRPILYGTTKEFLDFFSLNDLRELPTLREYSELTAESRKVMSDRLGVGVDASGADVADDVESSADAVDDASLAEAMDAAIDDSAAVEAVAAVDSSATLDRDEHVDGRVTAPASDAPDQDSRLDVDAAVDANVAVHAGTDAAQVMADPEVDADRDVEASADAHVGTEESQVVASADVDADSDDATSPDAHVGTESSTELAGDESAVSVASQLVPSTDVDASSDLATSIDAHAGTAESVESQLIASSDLDADADTHAGAESAPVDAPDDASTADASEGDVAGESLAAAQTYAAESELFASDVALNEAVEESIDEVVAADALDEAAIIEAAAAADDDLALREASGQNVKAGGLGAPEAESFGETATSDASPPESLDSTEEPPAE